CGSRTRGGVDEELAERNRWIRAEQKKINDSVTALINKRKLCKPVGASEKEATDKKKKEQEEEVEDEEENEEVATKSNVRATTRSSGLVRTSFVKVWYRIRALNNITTIGPVGYLIIHDVKPAHLLIAAPVVPATMDALKLHLERKKKFEERSFLGSYDSPSSSSSSSSSSGDEQPASEEENECARQKGGEESDGRRPMAEQERKVSDGNNRELLLPWKVEIRDGIQPPPLIEEISESKQQCTVDDADIIYGEMRVSDNRKSIDDKTILESQVDGIKSADPQNSTGDGNETNDRKKKSTPACSVSCDTSDINQELEKDKLAAAVLNMGDDTSSKNNKGCKRKSKEHLFGSKLSSIREEMREFYDSMDRFVDENKIVFKNGEVEGFWGEGKMVHENLQTDFTDDSKIQETGTKVSASEEDKLQWWSTKERKLKVKEMLKKREEEAKKNKAQTENTEINEEFQCCPPGDKKQPINITNNLQDTRNLVLKAVPSNVLPDSEERCSVKNANDRDCDQSAISENEKMNNKSENSFDKVCTSKTKRELLTDVEQSNSLKESLVQTMSRLSLEGTSYSSKLGGKRIREAEDIEVSNKKSFLIKEINPGRRSEERKSRSQISERCRQHLIQETRKFARKVSPLVDKCITNLIKETEDGNKKLQYRRYNRSFGEYLPTDYISEVNASKSAGDFGKQDNCNKLNDAADPFSEKQDITMQQTINSQVAASTSHSDIQLLANSFRQNEKTECKEDRVSPNEEYKTVATNIKKSIEMKVAQEN
ncbi:LOW QUALITY PROTEIN: uncharacterized protein, partial [Cardiocondyla obscurior]